MRRNEGGHRSARGWRFAVVVVFGVVLGMLSCATAVTPRAAAPLVPGTIAVGGVGGVGAGNEWDDDYGRSYAFAGGGVSLAAPVLVNDEVQLEVDGALVGGLKALPQRQWFIGTSAGARAWRALDDAKHWWVGADGNISAYSEIRDGIGDRFRVLQAEFRPLLAYEVTESVWIGTRPGAVIPWSNQEFLPIIDLPLSVMVQARGVRWGVEAGAQGPYFIPVSAGRIGVFFCLLW